MDEKAKRTKSFAKEIEQNAVYSDNTLLQSIS
jgi:hypothetical protein